MWAGIADLPRPVAELDYPAVSKVLEDDLRLHVNAAAAFIPALRPDAVYLATGGGMANFTMPGMAPISMAKKDFDDVLAMHLKGTFNLIRHAAGHWRERSKVGAAVSGRIITTTSGTGMRGNIGQSSYGAAKYAIASLTVTAAMELNRYGVTVNAISPVARTRMTENAVGLLSDTSEDAFDAYAPEKTPLRWWPTSPASRAAGSHNE